MEEVICKWSVEECEFLQLANVSDSINLAYFEKWD
jgi:hypothetical protein